MAKNYNLFRMVCPFCKHRGFFVDATGLNVKCSTCNRRIKIKAKGAVAFKFEPLIVNRAKLVNKQ